MNCAYVEQVLPLYVGRDLEDDRSILVTDHLQSCKRCAQVADEYAQTKQLLQRFEAPSFSDAVYADIRKQVLTEIERKSHAPAWSTAISQFFAPFGPPRMRWIAAALVLALSVTALYFITKRSNPIPHDVKVAESDTRDGAAGAPAATSSKDQNAGPNKRRLKQREKTIVSAARRDMFPSRMAATKASSSPNNVLTQPHVETSQPASARAPLRVEIQTSDRNIRIIWLSNERHQSGLRETSKGI